ncbi:MAG: SPOR domain-containing protein [Pseudomonadota bacterium]
MKALLFSLLLIFSLPLHAAPGAMVEAVQMPVWLERPGSLKPLAAGTVLRDGDVLRTGSKAHVLLRLGEGSTVKLGENARFVLESVTMRKAGDNLLFSAAMHVMRGAFRFTTQALLKLKSERDVRVRFSAITAGIRGTDVWGKSSDEKDVVCLLEGGISVTHDNGETVMMNQAMSFYVAPKNVPPLPVAPVPPEKIKEWAQETEIQTGQGITRAGGKWKVYLAAAGSQADALAIYDQLREEGYPAEISPAEKEGGWVYRVRIGQLPSRQEAQALAARLKARVAGMAEPVIGR